MKLLFVEDDSATIEAFQTALGDWNDDHKDGFEIQSETKKSCGEAVAYLEGVDSAGLTGMIVDLTLEDGEDIGNVLLQKLDDMHRRIPVVVFTATPAALQFPYLLAKYKKGEKRYEDIFELFVAVEQIGLTKILGCNGSIETMLQHVFNVAILPRVDSWCLYADSDGFDKAEKALSRSVVEHLHIAMDKDEPFAPDEFYISNLEDLDYVKSGEVLRYKNGDSPNQYVVVISPACDLALHGNPCKPKSDVVQVCELEPVAALFKSVGGCISKRIAKESQKAGDNSETLQEKVDAAIRSFHNQVLANQYAAYYHYFPAAVGFEGFIMNFRHLKTHSHVEVATAYDKTGYIVSPNFFRDIQSRFAAYYGRQGQPVICEI